MYSHGAVKMALWGIANARGQKPGELNNIKRAVAHVYFDLPLPTRVSGVRGACYEPLTGAETFACALGLPHPRLGPISGPEQQRPDCVRPKTIVPLLLRT